MPLDVLVSHLLLPAGAPPALRALRLPALERWLARADVETAPERTADAWLAARFGLEAPAPIAAIALAGDDAPRTGTWLRADPVHFRVDRDRATLHHTAILDIARDEADGLVDALRSHFAPDRLALVAPTPERWYLRVPAEEMPATTPLEDALGRDMLKLLPRGGGRLNWPAAFTEAQMVLGAHAVNAEREVRGDPAVNSVWFWGEGAAPATVAKRYGRINATDAFARGLAKLSGAALAPAPARLAEVGTGDEPILVVLDDLTRPWHRGDAGAWKSAAERLDRDWFDALGDAIKRFGEMRLILPSLAGTRVASLTLSSRWRWFRRGLPLHA